MAMLDAHSAQNERPLFLQPVRIVPDAHAHEKSSPTVCWIVAGIGLF
jgi:hypothetical protein